MTTPDQIGAGCVALLGERGEDLGRLAHVPETAAGDRRAATAPRLCAAPRSFASASRDPAR